MQTFADKDGLNWTISVTIGTIRSIKQALGYDLMPGPTAGDQLSRLAYDYEALVNAIYLCCKRQADERSIDDQAFGELFDGQALDAACEAFMEAYQSFCPALIRQGLIKTRAAQKKAETLALSHVERRLSDDQIQKMVEKAIDGALSSSSPATSAAIPTP